MPQSQEMVRVQSFASHAHRSRPRSNPQTEALRQRLLQILLHLPRHQLVMGRYQARRLLPPEHLALCLPLLRLRLPFQLPPQQAHRLQLLCLLQDRHLPHPSLRLDPHHHFKVRQTLRFRVLCQLPPPRVWVMAPSHPWKPPKVARRSPLQAELPADLACHLRAEPLFRLLTDHQPEALVQWVLPQVVPRQQPARPKRVGPVSFS